jgi:UDP-GlcNAc:undecaprenyl-phosphate GlcNAc-1-phosphate transferase
MPAWHGALFLVTALLSALLTLGVRRYVLKTKLSLSEPRERDVHRSAVPRLGGIAVTLSFLFVVVGITIVSPGSLHFIDTTIVGLDRNLFGILAGVLILLIVGIQDDIRGLSPLTKLLFHFLAGIILAWSLVLVAHITNPLGGKILLGNFTYIFVVLWVVGMINVINWLDGLDGLASGISLIATLALYLLAIKPEVNQLSMSVLAIVLAGSLVGFLPFNFYPAKIFLGDSGSQVLGFLLAVFAIISGGKLATAFLVLGVPILDVVWVIARRILSRKPIYQADRYHLHHRLLRAGLNQKQAVILLYALSAGFGIIALQTQSFGKLVALGVLVGIMVLGGGMLVLLDTLRTAK